jgi:hypothetical protein
MFCCRGWNNYCVDEKLPRCTLQHDNEVKVHITYFLPVEATTKAGVYFFSPIFFFVNLSQCHQQHSHSRLCGFYCAYHMLKVKHKLREHEVFSWDLHL